MTSVEQVTITRAEDTSFTVRLHPSPAPQPPEPSIADSTACPAEVTTAGAPVVLIVPAMGVHAGYYGKLTEAIREAGLTAADTELRGNEESGGRTPSRRYDYGYADLLDDVNAAVIAVRQRLPGAPVYLLGHSLGGHLGMVHAGQNPGHLAGLLLVASGSVWWRLWHPGMYLVGVVVSAMSRIFGYFPGHRVKFGGREARQQMLDWTRFNRTGRLEFGTPRVNHDPAIAEVDLPVLGMSFAGDGFAPAKAVDGLLAKMPKAQVTRLHVGEGTPEPPGHLRWARRPEVVLPDLVAWIKEQAARRAER